MKADKKNNVLEGIENEQLKRRMFTREFKAEVARHKEAENLTPADCARRATILGCATTLMPAAPADAIHPTTRRSPLESAVRPVQTSLPGSPKGPPRRLDLLELSGESRFAWV